VTIFAYAISWELRIRDSQYSRRRAAPKPIIVEDEPLLAAPEPVQRHDTAYHPPYNSLRKQRGRPKKTTPTIATITPTEASSKRVGSWSAHIGAERVREIDRLNLSPPEEAAKAGVSLSSWRRLKLAAGLPTKKIRAVKPPAPPTSPGRIARRNILDLDTVRAMVASGLNDHEIAREPSCNRGTILEFRKREGLAGVGRGRRS
jgi:hypothetical protein